jgi:hypothetical protein
MAVLALKSSAETRRTWGFGLRSLTFPVAYSRRKRRPRVPRGMQCCGSLCCLTANRRETWWETRGGPVMVDRADELHPCL